MRSPTALISVIAGCLTAASVSGQVSHHSPVIHHGSAKSFQSFTYFGRNSYPASQAFSESAPVTSSIKYIPPTTKAPYVAPTYVPLATPARYNPAAARATPAPYNPAPAPVSYSPAPAPAPYKPASVAYNSVAAPSPVVYNRSPAPAPASYNPAPAPVSYSTAPASAPYKPASVTYNSVAAPASFTYNKSPAPAPYNPSPAPVSYSTAPASYKPASVTYNSVAAPSPVVYNKSPAPAPASYNPAPASYSTAPAPYKPASVTYNSVAAPASFTYNKSPAPAPYNPSPAPVSYSTAPASYKPASVTYNSVAAPSAPASFNPSPAPVSYSTAPAPAPYNPASVTYNSVAAPSPVVKHPSPAPFIPQPVAFTSQPSQPAAFAPKPSSPTFRSFVHSTSPSLPASPSSVSVAVPAVPSNSQQSEVRNFVRQPVETYFRDIQVQATRNTVTTASTTVAPRFTTTTYKPFTISSTPFVPTELRTDIPASEIVDAALEDVKNEGPRLVEVVAKIQNNRLVKRIFNTVDPCNSLPENIAEVLQKLNEAAISSRSDLINIIAAAQEMKKNENNTQVVLLEASNALLAINPLLPIFREIFPKSEGCGSNVQATVVGFNQIGTLLEVLGTTNLVSTDDATKSKITKGGQTTKILADLAKKLEEGGFTSLCEGSSTFSSDVLMGVSELLKAFEKIADAFDAQSELSDLGKTVAVIRDGAVSII